MLIHAVLFIFCAAIGYSSYQISADQRSIMSSDEINLDAAENIYKFAKWVYITGNLGRIILVILSVKQPMVCKIYLIYDQIIILSEICML